MGKNSTAAEFWRGKSGKFLHLKTDGKEKEKNSSIIRLPNALAENIRLNEI